MIEPEDLREKSWVAVDDELHISDDFDPKWDTIEWSHDTFIAMGQIHQAFRDPDVYVCDIENDGESFVINIMLRSDSDEQNFPTLIERRLATTAAERFRHNTHKPGWEDEDVYRMLGNAIINLQKARRMSAKETGTDHDVEEEVADALNYMLFAMDILLDDE